MLGINKRQYDNMTAGIFTGLTDDQMFIIPYITHMGKGTRLRYESLLAQLPDHPKLTEDDVFEAQDFEITIKRKSDWSYVELTPEQQEKIFNTMIKAR